MGGEEGTVESRPLVSISLDVMMQGCELQMLYRLWLWRKDRSGVPPHYKPLLSRNTILSSGTPPNDNLGVKYLINKCLQLFLNTVFKKSAPQKSLDVNCDSAKTRLSFSFPLQLCKKTPITKYSHLFGRSRERGQRRRVKCCVQIYGSKSPSGKRNPEGAKAP